MIDEVLTVIKKLGDFTLKSIDDPTFLNTILDLLYTISGQEKVEIKSKKKGPKEEKKDDKVEEEKKGEEV